MHMKWDDEQPPPCHNQQLQQHLPPSMGSGGYATKSNDEDRGSRCSASQAPGILFLFLFLILLMVITYRPTLMGWKQGPQDSKQPPPPALYTPHATTAHTAHGHVSNDDIMISNNTLEHKKAQMMVYTVVQALSFFFLHFGDNPHPLGGIHIYY